MNYQSIYKADTVNGDGVRVSLFVSGCSHGCKNCYNEAAWDYRSGSLFTEVQVMEIIEYMKPDYIDGFSLLGGDPLAPKNIEECTVLLRRIKEAYPEKNVWCWTGYELQDVQDHPIIQYIDVLIPGKFIEELKDLSLPYRGSSNQQILFKTKDF